MAEYDPVQILQDAAAALRDQSDKLSSSVTAGGRRVWMGLPLNGWNGDMFNIAGIAASFARDESNERYQDAVLGAQKGTMGQAAARKLEIDTMAALERSFRMRHSSPIRAIVHAGGRRQGHGEAAGVHLNIVRHIQDILAAGRKE